MPYPRNFGSWTIQNIFFEKKWWGCRKEGIRSAAAAAANLPLTVDASKFWGAMHHAEIMQRITTQQTTSQHLTIATVAVFVQQQDGLAGLRLRREVPFLVSYHAVPTRCRVYLKLQKENFFGSSSAVAKCDRGWAVHQPPLPSVFKVASKGS